MNDALHRADLERSLHANLAGGKAMKLIHAQLLQIACVAVVALSVNAPSWGAEPNVVGTWKVVSFVAEELATGKKTAIGAGLAFASLFPEPNGGNRVLGIAGRLCFCSEDFEGVDNSVGRHSTT